MKPIFKIIIFASALLVPTVQAYGSFLSGPPPPIMFSDTIPSGPLPENWYAWNLSVKQESGLNPPTMISIGTNPTHWTWNPETGTEEPNERTFMAGSTTLVFLKPTQNEDGTYNSCYSQVYINFTPLTLGGLHVEQGAFGTTDKNTSKAPNSSFSLLSYHDKNSTANATLYLNILSAEDSKILAANGNTLPPGVQSTAVNFDLHENFTIGSQATPVTMVNIFSDWSINIEKRLNLYGSLQGGDGKTITLSGGGELTLHFSNHLLYSDWYIKDNTTLKFADSSLQDGANSNTDAPIYSANLLGTGNVWIENGIIIIAGDGATITNDLHILDGGKLTLHEQVRNNYTPDKIVYVNVTGNISGSGTFFKNSDPGKNATNESWIFTGDNSRFSGNWETNNDVDYIMKDKGYDYLPMVFGNGAAFQYGDNFHAIAGYGKIIGIVGQDSRIGMGVGINFGSDVILYNDLEGTLKLRHLSSYVLELRGTNTHGYGTYVTNGGTLRFTEAKNLGSLTVQSQKGTMIHSGGTIALNNGSSILFSGEGEVSLQNALFNTSGNWSIGVEHSAATLLWDLSTKGFYDMISSQVISGARRGDFTKTGQGALVITNGKLITNKADGTPNDRTIYIKEGTLAFSGQGTWGDAIKIILGGGTTLKSDREIVLESGITLTTDQTSHVPTTSTIDGDLTLRDNSIIEFVMGGETGAIGVNPLFNVFNVTGDLDLSDNAIFQFTFLNGLYVSGEGFYLLLTANNDLRTLQSQLDSINLHGIKGISETNSRQKYQLYASGTTEWKDKFGNIHAESYGNSDGKELYLYASPDAAILTWNKSTGGNWALIGDDSDRASWTGHDTDTRFYNNDTVIFGGNEGDITGEAKIINLVNDVSPSSITVTGSGHYVFSSENGSAITGQGSLLKRGDGILDINVSNTYSSGTKIQEGTVNANAKNAFGSGLISLGNAVLNVNTEDALGSSELTITGGILNIYASNSAGRKTLLNGGIINAYASNSLGSGTLLVENGSVYAKGANAIGGNIFITGSESHLYTEATNALGHTTVTVSNGAIIHHNAFNPESIGNGSVIILGEGGILEVNNSTALNALSNLKFDGGELRVNNQNIDLAGFNGIIEISNAQRAILNTIGENSRLRLTGQLGTMITANILKIGEGELIGALKGHFRASLEVAEGKATLIQSKDTSGNYTTYQFTGDLSGSGTMAFEGGSIAVSSAMHDFSGELYLDFDDEQQHLLIRTSHKDEEKPYDLTINRGNLRINDNSNTNIMYCRNLSSGDGDYAGLSTIGMSEAIDPSTVGNHAVLSLHQDRDDEFKGAFVNGGTLSTLTTSLQKEGSATLTLSGNSTTTGTLTIIEGTIQIGKGGTTGYWSGNIVNNSKLEMNYADTVKIYNKEISGSGLMDITTGENGRVVFTAKNTYTGGTNINNGNVQLKDAGTLGEGSVSMSGKSTLDVINGNGVENRTIRIAANSTVSIKTASLGNTGVLTTGGNSADPAAISIREGLLDHITLSTTSNKATLSGTVSGAAISLDASNAGLSPVLNNMTLGQGSSATAINGTSLISNRLSLSYGEGSIVGTSGNREIIDAKLVLGTNGSYDISQMSQLFLSVDQRAIGSLGDEERFSINIFGKDADLSNVYAGEDPSKLGNIALDALFQSEGWRVSQESLSGDTAWWNTGTVVLTKEAIPEPSVSSFFLATALLAASRRKRHK